jgi:peptide/nickel transport system permease protein
MNRRETTSFVLASPPTWRFAESRVWRAFRRNRPAIVGAIAALGIVVVAATAPILSPHDPIAPVPAERLNPPSAGHPFGQDDYGRDILPRVLWGARISLLVGMLSVLLATALGASLGIIAAYRGGKTESWIMRLVDVVLTFPDLITGLLVLAVLGAGFGRMILAIGLVLSPAFVRLTHSATLVIRNSPYIEAARAIGSGDGRIVSRHVVPNLAGDLVVVASLWMANAIRIEAGLSFIGLGVPPPTPTWGQMIRDGTVHLTNAPWFSILPGVAILSVVLAFNLLGDGLRDAFDPRTR